MKPPQGSSAARAGRETGPDVALRYPNHPAEGLRDILVAISRPWPPRRVGLSHSDRRFLNEAERVSTPTAKDPAFQARIRASFDRQGLMSTLGASILRVAPGAVDIALSPGPSVSQQHGFVHAGAVAAIADSAAGYAALSLMPPGAGVLTTDSKSTWWRPRPAASSRLGGRSHWRRRRLLPRARDERLVALLTSTLMII